MSPVFWALIRGSSVAPLGRLPRVAVILATLRLRAISLHVHGGKAQNRARHKLDIGDKGRHVLEATASVLQLLLAVKPTQEDSHARKKSTTVAAAGCMKHCTVAACYAPQKRPQAQALNGLTPCLALATVCCLISCLRLSTSHDFQRRSLRS